MQRTQACFLKMHTRHTQLSGFFMAPRSQQPFENISCRRQEPAAPLLESLADRLRMLEQPHLPTDPALNGIVQSLPPEVPFK